MADAQIPDKPALEGLETKWDAVWAEQGTYLFDRLRAAEVGRAGVYSVDTPPPTASGSLHIGHVFSYTHTDVKVRFERMRGKTVFYPMGWDDNGLPTERRVQNYYGVRCDPSLPYDADFTPPFEGGDNKSSKAADQIPISRRNFIELCESLTIEDEKHFESLFRQLGLSVDWTQTYRTISDDTIRTSQLADQLAGRGHLSMQRVFLIAQDSDGIRFLRFLFMEIAQQLGVDMDAVFRVIQLDRLLGRYEKRALRPDLRAPGSEKEWIA